MRRILIFTLLIITIACASRNNANRVSHTEISMSGGEYERKTWDDTIKFNRTSWYIGAIMGYDIMITRLDKSSPFAYWLGNNQDQFMSECREFYIGLIYTNTNSMMLKLASPADIKKQITELGFEEVSISNFRTNMAAHNVYGSWHMKNHKFAGFCYKKMSSIPKEIPISLPGFKTRNILAK